MSSIRLSPKHGVNPSLSQCFYCGGDKNEIILPGLMKGDAEAPHRAVWSMEPCDTCKGYMQQGIIVIEVDEAKTKDRENPYRAGNMAVMAEAWVRRVVTDPALAEQIIQKRVTFLPVEVWTALGLPRETRQ